MAINQAQNTGQGSVLLTAGSVASTYPGYVLPSKSYRDEVLIQISIAGCADVSLDGRIGSSMPWVVGVVSVRNASELVPIAWTPHVRVVVGSASAASVDVAIYHGNVITD